jgi:hypothetical protein
VKLFRQKLIRQLCYNIAFIFTIILSLNLSFLILNKSGSYLSIGSLIGYNFYLFNENKVISKKGLYFVNLITILVLPTALLINKINLLHCILIVLIMLIGYNFFFVLDKLLNKKFS